jgi:hypothetical protein
MKRAKRKSDQQSDLIRTKQDDHAGEELRLRSGFDPDNWNALSRLQVKVRDLIDYPVTMQEAIEVAIDALEISSRVFFRKSAQMLRERAEDIKREKASEQKRISEQAGR